MTKNLLLFFLLFICCLAKAQQQNIKIIFSHVANSKKVILNDSVYTNLHGETYTITKLKYYVSNIGFVQEPQNLITPSVYLVNAANNEPIIIPAPINKFTAITFLLGVDSVYNYSGAQTGALDPLNDMFWVWNTGYIMFKLEGKSPASTQYNKIEYHIGGYKAPYKTMQQITLPISNIINNTVNIQLDVDAFWAKNKNTSIAKMPVVTTTGALTANIANNFKHMFTIIN